MAPKLDFRPGSIVVADRGYNNYTWFREVTGKVIFFVTRLKRNASYRLLEPCPVNRKKGVPSADIYKERWQIGFFFKEIKHNLHIKRFVITSENAVLTQIYSALIVYLLLVFQKFLSKTGASVQHQFELISVNPFGSLTLDELQHTRRQSKKNVNENSLLEFALTGQ